MVEKKYIGAFVILFLVAGIGVKYPDVLYFKTLELTTDYKIWNGTRYILAATGRLKLRDGAMGMNAKSRIVINETDGDIFKTIRMAKWRDNITTIHTFYYNLSLNQINLIPLEATLECFNCVGKIVMFEYSNIKYNESSNHISSPFYFGNRMKLEWQDGAYYSQVKNYKTVSDKIIIKYRPYKNHQIYHVRMFDPPEESVLESYNGIEFIEITEGKIKYYEDDVPIWGLCEYTDYLNCKKNKTVYNETLGYYQDICDEYEDVYYPCITKYKKGIKSKIDYDMIGYQIDYLDGREEFINETCCKFYPDSPYKRYSYTLISCREKIAGVCNPKGLWSNLNGEAEEAINIYLLKNISINTLTDCVGHSTLEKRKTKCKKTYKND